MSGGPDGKPPVKVWDLLVRTGHWPIVIGIVAAWFTRGKWHEWIGYAVIAVVAVRVLWGLVGSRYARFAQFIHSPGNTLRYGKQILDHREPRHIGHNPLGGWMIVALLVTLSGVCITGWLFSTDRFWGVEWMEELHEWLTYFLLGLAAPHIGGVVFSSLRHKENLVASMLQGRKRAPEPQDIA